MFPDVPFNIAKDVVNYVRNPVPEDDYKSGGQSYVPMSLPEHTPMAQIQYPQQPVAQQTRQPEQYQPVGKPIARPSAKGSLGRALLSAGIMTGIAGLSGQSLGNALAMGGISGTKTFGEGERMAEEDWMKANKQAQDAADKQRQYELDKYIADSKITNALGVSDYIPQGIKL